MNSPPLEPPSGGGDDAALIAGAVSLFASLRISGARPSVDRVVLEAASSMGLSKDSLQFVRTRAISAIAEASRAQLAARDDGAFDFPSIHGYEIIDLVGRGGMGVVFEAYQLSTGRRVALKVMRDDSASTSEGRQRFAREIELVARLQHPGIVAVFDSGLYAGRHYLVMEFIDGVALDAFLPPGEAPVDKTLATLAQIADAADYAHQRGVLHRDIKPSNILIDAQGRPHLLDFGLAKAIDPVSAAARGDTLSQPGQLLGTPAFMAPEQARGDGAAISVRCDVYSLGAIAYLLLAGKPPVDVRGPLAEVLSRIEHADPLRPSRLRPALSADVDAIVMHALAKEPQRRYATAGDLAADIRRWSDGRTIMARPGGARQRAWRWVKRNSALALVSLAALIVVFAIGLTALVRVLHERDRARTAAVKSDTINRFLQEMIGSPNLSRGHGRDVRVLTVLDASAPRIDAELADQPEVAAELHVRIAETYTSLEAYEKAVAHARRALALLPALSEPARSQTEAQACHVLGRALGGGDAASTEEAERMLRRCEELAIAHPEILPGFVNTIRKDLAELLIEKGRVQESITLIERVIVEQRARLPASRADLAAALIVQATALNIVGSLPQAQSAAEEALAAARSLREGEYAGLAHALLTYAAILNTRGLAGEALKATREAYDVSRRVYGPDSPSTIDAAISLCWSLYHTGDLTGAIALGREALNGYRAALGPRTGAMAEACKSLSSFLADARQFDEAIPLGREAVQILKDNNQDDTGLAAAHRELALTLLQAGQPVEAEEQYRSALRIERAHPDIAGPGIVDTLGGLSNILTQRGELKEAAALLEESLLIARGKLGPNDPKLGKTLCGLAASRSRMGDFPGAESAAREALPILRTEAPYTNLFIARTLITLGGALVEQRKSLHEGLADLREGVELLESIPNVPESYLAISRGNIGVALLRLGRFDEAETLLLDLFESASGSSEPAAAEAAGRVKARLVELYESWGKPEEAAKFQTPVQQP